jgi:general nucleoside transport system ATP-binding protein
MRVELEDIHKWFGPIHANDSISLTLEEGTIYALLGENGAGKSTLMKILSGYQQPSSGVIKLNGKSADFATPTDALKAGIGMLYQDPADFPPLRVSENYLYAYNDDLILDFAAAERTLTSLGSRFNFHVNPHVYVDSLTLGERQQMELMRLLALGAEVLILDEPTTGISAEQKDILFSTMRRLAHEERKTIILVSHKLEEVHELCDKVAVLRAGRLVGTRDLPAPTADLVRLMFGAETPREDHQPFVKDQTVLALDHASFGTYLLKIENISLDVYAGEVLGLAGLEGSGQRELLQASAGLLPVNSGSISFQAAPLKGKRSPFFWMPYLAWAIFGLRTLWLIIQRISGAIPDAVSLAGGIAETAMVAGAVWLLGEILIAWTSRSAYHDFQQRGGAYVPAGRLEEGLISGLCLTDHMALVDPDRRFFVDWDSAHSAVTERIKRYNIVGRPETEVDMLSGGNQQRTMLCLLNEQLRLILLEHPTRGLDVTSANWIWELFAERRQQGTAIMFMSSDLDELMHHSDRIAVFSGGHLIRIVSARETSVDELGHLIGGQV